MLSTSTHPKSMNGLRWTLGPLTLATYYVSLPFWIYLFNPIGLSPAHMCCCLVELVPAYAGYFYQS